MYDTSDIHGNPRALRALEIAAAGHHGLLLVGSAAAPKTPIARRLLGLLPPPAPAELSELETIYTASGQQTSPVVRPFRAPHWTASEAGLVGAGGARCLPGEVSLAHAGVLYLERAPEFRRAHLDAIARTIRRGYAFLPQDAHCLPFAARPLVVAGAEPCPCGIVRGRCECRAGAAYAYLRRLAPLGSLLDLCVEVSPEQHGQAWEASDVVGARVREAQAFRERRGAGPEPESAARLLLHVQMGPHWVETLSTSDEARARRLHVARTIADLDGSAEILDRHVGEATHLTTGLETLF